jgi:anti-sigma B factor antagonist
MNLTQEKLHGTMVLYIQEERIDAHNSTELKEFILGAMEQGENNFVIQLAKVRFVDSSGLGALLSGYKNAESRGGKLALSNLQPQVLSMFELTRLNRVFEIYPELADAFDNAV